MRVEREFDQANRQFVKSRFSKVVKHSERQAYRDIKVIFDKGLGLLSKEATACPSYLASYFD